MMARKPLFFVALILVFLLACVSASALDWAQNLTVAGVDSDGYDIAASAGNAHVVYQNGGEIFYTKWSLGSGWSSPISLGTGSAPSIAADSAGNAHVVFHKDGSIYAASGGGWTPSLVTSGSYGSLGIGPDGVMHLLVEGNLDSDIYTEVVHLSNAGSGWSSPDMLKDGAVDGNLYTTFAQSSLAALSGGYVYALEFKDYKGRASWSNKYAQAFPAGGTEASRTALWNDALTLSRQSVSSGVGGIGFVFTHQGSVCYGRYLNDAWSELASIGEGGQASVDTTSGINIVYANGGLHYFDGTTLSPVMFGGSGVTGANPFIAGDGTDLFILYRDSAGALSLLTTVREDIVPEPSGVLVFAAGSLGIIGLAARRRRV